MDASTDEQFIEPLSIFRRKKVEFAEAPEFTQRLTSFLEVEVGKSATFVGQFKSLPEVKVRWFKDEEQLTESGKHAFECARETGVVRLTISHLNRKDEGAYKCRVENQEGVATTTGYLSVIASKNRGRRSSKRKCGSERVSSPPSLLKPIVEQRSIEESEEKEYSSMPPSPLHRFLASIRHSAKSLNAPIVYGPLENFDDILDTESQTDDEEVFEVNNKSWRSSDDDDDDDEEDFSTGESSSEAETAKTAADQLSLPRMLGLNKHHQHNHHQHHRLPKLTPITVRTSKKRIEGFAPAACTTAQQSSSSSSPSSSSSSAPPSESSPARACPSRPLSSQSRPLVFPRASLEPRFQGSAQVDWNLGRCCVFVCFVSMATFVSIRFSIPPFDVIVVVVVIVCTVSALSAFLQSPANDDGP